MAFELKGRRYEWNGREFQRLKKSVGDLLADGTIAPTVSPLLGAVTRAYADFQALSLLTQGAHWNTRGPEFYQLHQLFQRLYEQLSESVDRIAEHIRYLGGMVPVSFQELAMLTAVGWPVPIGNGWDSSIALNAVLAGHMALERSLKDALIQAQMTSAEATVNLLSDELELCGNRVYLLESSI